MRNGQPITAYIALGSNLGDRRANIRAALSQLRETEGIEVGRQSELIETVAEGMAEDSPAFLNGVVEVQTTLGSHALLHRLLEIEKSLGRERRDKWASRPIDLDLLFYGDQILSSQELIVPHPLMHERKFVLQPLAQIAPNFVHPTLQMTIAGLLEGISGPRK